MYGANTDDLRRLALHLEQAASVLETGSRQLQAQVSSTNWTGDTAQRFMWEWSRLHRPSLAKVAQDLRTAAMLARRNADGQDAASDARSGTTPWTGVNPGALLPGLLLPGFRFPGSLLPGGAGGAPGWLWDKVDDLAGLSDAALLALGFVPKIGAVPSWLASTDDWLALRLLGTDVSRRVLQLFGGHVSPEMYGRIGGLTSQLGHHTGAGGLLKPLSNVGTWVGVGLSAVVGGVDVFMKQRDNGWGDAQTISAEVDGTLSTAFSFVPGGSLVYSASRTVTDVVYGTADETFNLSGQVVDDYARRAYHVDGADQLTAAQADEVTERYQGWSGLANSTGDGIIAAGRGAGNVVKNAWRGVTSIF